jgi:UDP-3-O-[3-hydroxymyristoyl] glucosamine N-acyltransferase
VTIGDHVVIAGQAGIADHVTLAAGVVVGAQAGVPHDLQKGMYLGTPAMQHVAAGKSFAVFARLPEMRRELRAVVDRCAKLEAELQALRARIGE